jgi:hypothetical protein
VLRPQQREDCQLEVIRLSLEKLADPRQLAVCQPEGAMERLFRDRGQSAESSRLTGRVAPAFYGA